MSRFAAQPLHPLRKLKFLGAFKIYVYNFRWVGGQKFGKFVNVYNKEIVNGGRWGVKNM